MSVTTLDGIAGAALTALPHGLWVYDAEDRLVFVNPAALAFAGVPPGAIPLGTARRDLVRMFAFRGAFGPGDPDVVAAEYINRDRGQPYRRLIRRANGDCQELRGMPLPGGGIVVVLADISGPTRAAEESAAQAQRLEEVLARLRDGIALFDADSRLVLSNPAYEDLTGTPRGLVRPGISYADILGALARRGAFAEPEAWVADRLALDRSRPQVSQRLRPDGGAVRFVSQPMPDGWLVEAVDITAERRAEDEASRRAALLKGVLDALPVGVLVLSPDNVITMMNAAYDHIMDGSPAAVGERREEVARRRALAGEYGPGEAPALVQANLVVVSDHGQVRRRTRPNGLVVEHRSAALPDGGYVQVVSDITALQRAEAEATARAGLLQVMLDNMRHGILLFDAEQRLVAGNALATTLMGLQPRQMRPGRKLGALIADQWRAGELGPVPEDVPDEMPPRAPRNQPVRYSRVRPDGTVVEVISDPMPDGGFVVTFSDITARARAEAEARQRATTLQGILDNLRNGVVLYGPDRTLVAANALAASLSGFPPEAAMPGRTLDSLLDDMVALDPAADPVATALAVEGARALDRSKPSTLVRRDWKGRVLEVHSDPMPDGGFLVTLVDVTALAQAEAQASARAAMLQAMLDNMRQGVILFDAGHRLVVCNELGATLTGLEPADLHPGRTYVELVRLQHLRGAYGTGPEAERQVEEMLRADWSRPIRFQRTTAAGGTVEVAADPMPDGGFVVTLADITALTLAEAEAKRRAGMLQAMLDNIRHGICLFDREGHALASNPVLRDMLALPPGLLAPGQHFTVFVEYLLTTGEYGTGPEAAANAARIRELDRRKGHRSVRARPDGTVMEVVSDPTPDGGWVLTFTDVTGDRRIRAELERAKAAAEAADRAKSRFLATMSHELRTPLNAVIGFSEAIKADPDPERGKEYVDAIHEAGRHLLSLIDDILDVARADTGAFEVTEREVDVAALAEAVLRAMGEAAATADVVLTADLAPGLPRVRADETRLRQVLLNLLSNAVKFTPAGGSVRLGAAEEAGELVLRITDTGIGMEPESIPRAFEPFTQLDSSLSRRFGGSGIGLTLSRALAEAQDLHLDLESAPGAGTTAILRIPAARLLRAAA